MTKVPTELVRALRQVRIYDKKEVDRAFAALKEENERLQKVCARAEDLAEECDALKARVAVLEARIKLVVENYEKAIAAQGIEAHAESLNAFIDSVRSLKEPANEG